MARFEQPAPSAFQRWVAAHARVLYGAFAVVTGGCVWWLAGAVLSHDTRDVVGSSLTTLSWVCLTLQVRVVVRHVDRYDRRTSGPRPASSARRGRS